MSDEKVLTEYEVPASEAIDKKAVKPTKGTIKQIIEGVKQMNDTVNQFAQMKSMDISMSYHLDPGICDELMPYSLQDIGDMNVEEMISHIRPFIEKDFDIDNIVVSIPEDYVRNKSYIEMILKHTDESWESYSDKITAIFRSNYEREMENDVLDLKKPLTDEEYANLTEDITITTDRNEAQDSTFKFNEDAVYTAMLLDIKKKDLEYLKADTERRSITKDANQALKDMDSDVPGIIKRMRKTHEDRLEEISSQLTGTEDDPELVKESAYLYDFLSYKFVWKRAIVASERRRIKDIFKKENLSNYVIERYERTMKKLGFREDLWKSFISLEEKYAGEDFYAYNNLFLFIYMRWASHLNLDKADDKEEALLVTQELINLANHYDDNATSNIINCIKNTDSLFEEDIEWFIENNTNSPLNPECIKNRNANSNLRRDKIKAAYEKINYLEEWDDTLTNDELQKKLADHIDNISKSQLDEFENISGVTVDIEKNEEGEDMVVITPPKPSDDVKLETTVSDEGGSAEDVLMPAT